MDTKIFKSRIHRVPDWIQVSKVVSKEFQIGYKFQKSYLYDLGLDTSFENRIRMTLDWIQIQNFESVSEGYGYNFSKMYPQNPVDGMRGFKKLTKVFKPVKTILRKF